MICYLDSQLSLLWGCREDVGNTSDNYSICYTYYDRRCDFQHNFYITPIHSAMLQFFISALSGWQILHLVTSDICVIYLLTLVANNLALVIITWWSTGKCNMPITFAPSYSSSATVRQAVVSQVEERKETKNAHLKSEHSFPRWPFRPGSNFLIGQRPDSLCNNSDD